MLHTKLYCPNCASHPKTSPNSIGSYYASCDGCYDPQYPEYREKKGANDAIGHGASPDLAIGHWYENILLAMDVF